MANDLGLEQLPLPDSARNVSNPVFSPDGKKVAFLDNNHVYVEDLATHVTTVVYTYEGSTPSLGGLSFSPDGTKFTFTVALTTTIAGTDDGLYVKDLTTGALTRLAAPSSLISGGLVYNPSFSPDGTQVIFGSDYNNLVADGSDTGEVYIADIATGAISRVDTTSSGGEGHAGSTSGTPRPVFSADGQKVLFESYLTNLVPGDTNGLDDVFIKDLTTGAITRVSTAADGTQADNTSTDAVFSPDGSKVYFISSADNLVEGDTNNNLDIFVKDLKTGAISRVSTATDGSQISGGVGEGDLSLSPDGTELVFTSSSPDLTGSTNGYVQVFVKDLITGEVTMLSADSSGKAGDGNSITPTFSPDGTFVTFASTAESLGVSKESGTGIFVTKIPAQPESGADTYNASYSKPLIIDAAHGLLANDEGLNGNSLIVASYTQAAHGKVQVNADGSFTYTPNGTFVGDDSFTYRAYDGIKTGTDTTVTLDVNGNIQRVSTTSTDAQIDYVPDDGDLATNNLAGPALSPDGTKILFSSSSPSLPGAAPAYYQQTGLGYSLLIVPASVYMKDLTTGVVTNISAGASGTNSYGETQGGIFSPDATKVYFTAGSHPNSIIENDLATGTLTEIPLGANELIGSGTIIASNAVSTNIAVSPDGTKLAFVYETVGDTANEGIFIKDLTTGATTEVVGSLHVPVGSGAYGYESIGFSQDGTKLVFSSTATNLVAGDTNNNSDVFVEDLTTGAITRVSTSASGVQGDRDSFDPTISPDGRYVAFVSFADNLGPNNSGHDYELFLKDLTTGTVTRLSSAGTEDAPVFSPDGSEIAYVDAVNNVQGVYVRNLITGTVRLVSTDSFDNAGNNGARFPVFSEDGTKIAFFSYSSNLVPGDTNAGPDIFIKDLTEFPLGSTDNQPPSAKADTYDVEAGSSLNVPAAAGVLANDTDANGDALAAVLAYGPSHGSLSLNADGSFQYTPVSDFIGADQFAYWASDGTDTSVRTVVSLNVKAQGSTLTPIAVDDTFTVDENKPLTISIEDFLNNDLNTEDGAWTVSVIADSVKNGTLTHDANGYTYTPDKGFTGKETFSYQVVGSTGESNFAFVTLDVEQTGSLSDGYISGASVFADANGNGIWDENEAGTETDSSGTFHLTGASGPLVATGGFDIATNLPFEGVLMAPSGATVITPLTTLLVSLQSEGVTDPQSKIAADFGLDPSIDLANFDPVAATSAGDANGAAVFLAGTQVEDTLSMVAAFVAGAEGQENWSDTSAALAALTAAAASGHLNLSDPSDITAIITAALNGTPANADAIHGAATIIAAVNASASSQAGQTGAAALTILSATARTAQYDVSQTLFAAGGDPTQMQDAVYAYTGDQLQGAIGANIAYLGDVDGPGINNAPLTVADHYSVTEDTPLTIASSAGLLANERDPDGDPLYVVVDQAPSHGGMSLNADGSFTYTPDEGYTGTDTLTYKAIDTSGASSVATVTFDVHADVPPPVANNDTFTLSENGVLTFTQADLFANDKNLTDGTYALVTAVPKPAHGQISATEDGKFLYIPDQGYSGSDSFTYQIEGGSQESNQATVTVQILPSDNEPTPVSYDDQFSLKENGSFTFALSDLVANDKNVNESSVVDVLTDPGPLHGRITGNADGTLTYTPDAGFTGQDDFTYLVMNGSVEGNMAHVALIVTPDDSSPCYCPGTLIATDRGEVAVEDLAIGDLLRTVSGALRPIKWIGHRAYAGRFIIGRKDILPVCIEAGALAHNVPRQDLWVSPNHALYLEGVLIEARDLINEVSIYQADVAEEVTYFHVELDSHDVILAEGAWAETYLDDDNRGLFYNAHDFSGRYPDRAPEPQRYYAPRLQEGLAVEGVRRKILNQRPLGRAAIG